MDVDGQAISDLNHHPVSLGNDEIRPRGGAIEGEKLAILCWGSYGRDVEAGKRNDAVVAKIGSGNPLTWNVRDPRFDDV